MIDKKRLVISSVGFFLILMVTMITFKLIAQSSMKRASSFAVRDNYEMGTSSYGMPSFGSAASIAQKPMAQDRMAESLIMPPINPSAPVVDVDSKDRKIVKNGSLNIVVKDVQDGVKKVGDHAVSLGGYVATTNLTSSGNKATLSGYIRVRVPVDKVNDFINFVKSSSVKVLNENINSDDVTAEFVDLQARIRNLEASETQYLEFMDKATNVTEVLAVQKELTTIRGQIEQLKGQLQYLEGNSAMSDITVNVALDEGELPIPPQGEWKPDVVFKGALRDLLSVAKNLSYLAIYLVVFAIIWVPVGFGLKKLHKFLQKKIR